MSVAQIAPRTHTSPADGVVVARRPAPPVMAPQAAAAKADSVTISQPVKPGLRPLKFGDVAKVGGKVAGGAIAGVVATSAVDLLFHFGNNGGKSYAGGVYLAGAALGAAALGYFALKRMEKDRAQH